MNDLVGLVSNHQQEFTPLIKLFIVMTFMMFLPTIIFMMTSFVRIIITFSFLKSALGAQQSIPNQILVGIALVLTIFIMSPVVDKINKEGGINGKQIKYVSYDVQGDPQEALNAYKRLVDQDKAVAVVGSKHSKLITIN